MTSQIDLPQLYRGRAINLWVEDRVTAAYLNAIWSDSDFRILVAGGRDAVKALCDHSGENKLPNVFGVVDRDFFDDNSADWLSPNKTFRRFVLPVHEVENLLLDDEAMAGCVINDARKDIVEIKARIETKVSGLVPWMSCRAVLAESRRSVLDGFPKHPKTTEVPDLNSARTLIKQADWFVKIADTATRVANSQYIEQRLSHFDQQYQQDLSSGDWRASFSGKELFRDAVSYFYQSRRSGADRDEDAAKAIAQWQVQNSRIPDCISNLRKALRTRVGL